MSPYENDDAHRTTPGDLACPGPLTTGYELAVLQRAPGSRGGRTRLVLTGQPLFQPGAVPGSQVSVRVTCEPSDTRRTEFTVVTREPEDRVPRYRRRMRPLLRRSAAVPPGTYVLTAELTAPGAVRLDGLPVPLDDADGSWDDLLRLLPAETHDGMPEHLVCLVETCGDPVRLKGRLDRLEDLVTTASAGSRALAVSVIAYGAHGVAWRVPDRPPVILAWAAPAPEAVHALRGLADSRPAGLEYPGAAQLECALRLAGEHLDSGPGRPVIVTAGRRPPHPPGLDTDGLLVPCPAWEDWELALDRLCARPGITFGAFTDPDSTGRAWPRLGRDAAAVTDDAVDMDRFAADLGLRAAAPVVPFPVLEQ